MYTGYCDVSCVKYTVLRLMLSIIIYTDCSPIMCMVVGLLVQEMEW